VVWFAMFDDGGSHVAAHWLAIFGCRVRPGSVPTKCGEGLRRRLGWSNSVHRDNEGAAAGVLFHTTTLVLAPSSITLSDSPSCRIASASLELDFDGINNLALHSRGCVARRGCVRWCVG
jgi:hypothetical protein